VDRLTKPITSKPNSAPGATGHFEPRGACSSPITEHLGRRMPASLVSAGPNLAAWTPPPPGLASGGRMGPGRPGTGTRRSCNTTVGLDTSAGWSSRSLPRNRAKTTAGMTFRRDRVTDRDHQPRPHGHPQHLPDQEVVSSVTIVTVWEPPSGVPADRPGRLRSGWGTNQ
jgi:hypothetical protein